MADDIDRTEEREAFALEMATKAIREKAAAIPAGEPGDCDGCGETFERLVEINAPNRWLYHGLKMCGRCRDIRGLG
jgi:hypothetical protein